MKTLSKLFVLIVIIPFLSGCQIADSSFSSDTNSGSSEPLSDIEKLEKKLPVFYYDVINPYSDTKFDYKAPIETAARLRPIDSNGYLFEGETGYEVVSIFDNIPLQNVVDYSDHSIFENEQYVKDLLNGIQITVKYRDPLSEKDSVLVRFRVSEDGRFGFLTADQTILFYTDQNAISYEDVKTRIKGTNSNRNKENRCKNKNEKSAFALKQNRNDYIITPNGSGILVYYDSEMSQEEIEVYNQLGDELVPTATRIANSSLLYNCHSFAWYFRSVSNNCVVYNPSLYHEDGTYEEVSGIGDIGDIICYYDSNNDNIHSGVVIAKTEGISNNVCGNSDLVTVRSKWGPWALYEHRGDQCPYTSTYGGDATYVKYYRVHTNESIPLSNPSQNTPQIINIDNYVTVLPNVFGQTSHYAMYELNISYAKSYSFEIIADYYLDVSLFKGPMVEVNINNATIYENGVYKVAFNCYATPNLYYLRVTYENSSHAGTIYTTITNLHTHSYSNSFFWYDYTKHYANCVCSASTFDPHVVSANAYNKGIQYAICLLCHGLASIGIAPFLSLSSLPTSFNGSFILPNGIIVLVDEDVEAYFNGTLVFHYTNSV